MKKSCFTLILLFCISFTNAQHGKIMDDLNLNNKILKAERKFAVYFPPDYETSSRRYPVLYILHNHTDDHTGWVQFGEVLHIADKTILSGDATPLIIVMPDANTVLLGYTNALSGKWNYKNFFFEEFIP